jgi:hypothetical protein
MLIEIGPWMSLSYRMEAARQLGYLRIKGMLDWLRNRPSASPAKKMGAVAPR